MLKIRDHKGLLHLFEISIVGQVEISCKECVRTHNIEGDSRLAVSRLHGDWKWTHIPHIAKRLLRAGNFGEFLFSWRKVRRKSPDIGEDHGCGKDVEEEAERT